MCMHGRISRVAPPPPLLVSPGVCTPPPPPFPERDTRVFQTPAPAYLFDPRNICCRQSRRSIRGKCLKIFFRFVQPSSLFFISSKFLAVSKLLQGVHCGRERHFLFLPSTCLLGRKTPKRRPLSTLHSFAYGVYIEVYTESQRDNPYCPHAVFSQHKQHVCTPTR